MGANWEGNTNESYENWTNQTQSVVFIPSILSKGFLEFYIFIFAHKVLRLSLRKIEEHNIELKLNPVALFRERTIPTERLPLVGEVSANG
jgi:hypothetical protein